MPAHFGCANRAPFIVRLLALVAAAAMAITAACSGNPPTTPNATGIVTEQTKNPLADLAAAATAGKPLYSVHCAFCHGAEGKAEDDSTTSLPAKPTDLTSPDVTSDADGGIFLAIKNGKTKDGKITMPPASKLTDEQIWQVVAYVRALAKP